MKSISAAIVIAAGIGCFVGGAFVDHTDTKAFVMLVGGAVSVAGAAVWFLTLKHER